MSQADGPLAFEPAAPATAGTPASPASIPLAAQPARRTGRQTLPGTVRTLWQRIAVLRALLFGLVALVIFGLNVWLGDAPSWLLLIPVLIFVVVAATGVAWAGARWRSWSFELTDRWITASSGVLNRRTVTVPRNRVQTVTTENGPIDRWLELTSITVHTAGGASPNLGIPHLEDDVVAWLRSELGQGVAST